MVRNMHTPKGHPQPKVCHSHDPHTLVSSQFYGDLRVVPQFQTCKQDHGGVHRNHDNGRRRLIFQQIHTSEPT